MGQPVLAGSSSSARRSLRTAQPRPPDPRWARTHHPRLRAPRFRQAMPGTRQRAARTTRCPRTGIRAAEAAPATAAAALTDRCRPASAPSCAQGPPARGKPRPPVRCPPGRAPAPGRASRRSRRAGRRRRPRPASHPRSSNSCLPQPRTANPGPCDPPRCRTVLRGCRSPPPTRRKSVVPGTQSPAFSWNCSCRKCRSPRLKDAWGTHASEPIALEYHRSSRLAQVAERGRNRAACQTVVRRGTTRPKWVN